MFFCGAMTRAEIQRIVCIDSVSCGREAALQGHCIEHGEKLIFAVEAAVRGIRAISRILHLVRVNKFVNYFEGADKFVDRRAIVFGETR